MVPAETNTITFLTAGASGTLHVAPGTAVRLHVDRSGNLTLETIAQDATPQSVSEAARPAEETVAPEMKRDATSMKENRASEVEQATTSPATKAEQQTNVEPPSQGAPVKSSAHDQNALGRFIDECCELSTNLKFAPDNMIAIKFIQPDQTQHYLMPIAKLPPPLDDYDFRFGTSAYLMCEKEAPAVRQFFASNPQWKVPNPPAQHLAAKRLDVSA